MKSINAHDFNNPIRSGGGTHKINLGVRYTDPDDPEYEHALVWKFQPTLATDAQTPYFDIRGFLHKKYWKDIRDDTEYSLYTTDDGSNLVESHGMFETVDTKSVPRCVRDHLGSLFGSEVQENTFNAENAADNVVTPSVAVPDDAEPFTATVKLVVNASATEDIPEDDPRTADGSFTNHMKDGDGETIQTSHAVQHAFSWWIAPTETDNGPRLQVEQCSHKTWDEGMVGSFECEYENEKIVTAHRTPSETPSLDSLPKDVLETIAQWLGEPIVERTLRDVGGTMPTYVYECVDCDDAYETTPRQNCPVCGSGALCRYESKEQYREHVDDETEKERAVKEMLATADLRSR